MSKARLFPRKVLNLIADYVDLSSLSNQIMWSAKPINSRGKEPISHPSSISPKEMSALLQKASPENFATLAHEIEHNFEAEPARIETLMEKFFDAADIEARQKLRSALITLDSPEMQLAADKENKDDGLFHCNPSAKGIMMQTKNNSIRNSLLIASAIVITAVACKVLQLT